MDFRTVPVRSEQPHGTIGAPSDSAKRLVMSSVTKANGRISRNSLSREYVIGGSALTRPVNRALRKNDSQKSSAVWPKAMTLAPSPREISYTARRRSRLHEWHP